MMGSSKPLRVFFINDDVMGGKSTCSYKPLKLDDGKEVSVFAGTVSTENNGGFCSVRFDTSGQKDFSKASGVMIKAESQNPAHKDGFQFFIRDKKCNEYMATNWKVGFSATLEGVYIPFSSLTLESFGRPLAPEQSWELNLEQILEMGFYAKKEAIQGDFNLRVHDLALSNKPK
jgi:hypothetical protein